MDPLKTEAVGHIAYGPHEPTAFMLSDDLLEAFLGDKVYVRVGDKRHRILARLMPQRGLTAVNNTKGTLR